MVWFRLWLWDLHLIYCILIVRPQRMFWLRPPIYIWKVINLRSTPPIFLPCSQEYYYLVLQVILPISVGKSCLPKPLSASDYNRGHCFFLGSEIYQETLTKALTKYFGTRLLLVDSLLLPGVSFFNVFIFLHFSTYCWRSLYAFFLQIYIALRFRLWAWGLPKKICILSFEGVDNYEVSLSFYCISNVFRDQYRRTLIL